MELLVPVSCIYGSITGCQRALFPHKHTFVPAFAVNDVEFTLTQLQQYFHYISVPRLSFHTTSWHR